MTLAWVSVGALVLAVALSVLTTINVGILSLAMAWLVGVYLGGMSVNSVLSGFPVPLLVTLVGVTLLFSMADTNGTLSRLTGRAVRLCRGNAGLLPVMFFALGVVVSTIGPGGTPASALLAAPAMAVAGRVGISPLLMALMAGNGALAGTLSPFAPGGIIANDVMARIGLGGLEWQTYGYNVLAHSIVGIGGFVLFGGLKLFRRREGDAASVEPDVEHFERRHWLTIAGISALIVAVVGFDAHVGLTAVFIASVLTLLGSVDEQKAIQRMPWSVILMVTGVTVLISIMQKTQGMDLFTSGLASISSSETVVPIMAFGTRPDIGLQQHVRRGDAGVPADGAGPRAAAWRRRTRSARVVDHRGWRACRSLGALHRGRPVPCRGAPWHQHARAVQRAPLVGALDVRGRRSASAGFCSDSPCASRFSTIFTMRGTAPKAYADCASAPRYWCSRGRSALLQRYAVSIR